MDRPHGRGAVPLLLPLVIAIAALAWPARADSVAPLPGPAWVSMGSAFVHGAAGEDSAIVGELDRGDRVVITRCQPDCADPKGWAFLGDGAAAPRRAFTAGTPPPAWLDAGSEATYTYAKVIHPRIAIRRAPHDRAAVLRRVGRRTDLALLPDSTLDATGWFRTSDGGYVARGDVQTLTPSDFAGEPLPHLPLAFFVRDTKVRPETTGPDGDALRFSRVPFLGMSSDGRVLIPGGSVPRHAVRLAFQRPRPPTVLADAKWVHVDTREQVLVAYEGDHAVLATLVATGAPRAGERTRPGVFPVWRKIIHSSMVGRAEVYDVEEVPYVQYFHLSQALHGTFWHDHFGSAGSHGCVNLSMADARWLFEWAPPALPKGWAAIRPVPGGIPGLWVQVERAASVGAVRTSPGILDTTTSRASANPGSRTAAAWDE